MTLATLKPGDSGRIKSIKVNGSMKRRLMDMGLLEGEDVCVKRVAPFGDPIVIDIKGCTLSIRKNEAEEILLESDINREGKRTIVAAIVGNPNSGKSTLINAIAGTRLKVGNWSGVTVDKMEAELEYDDSVIRLVDLPGAYSLSPYTQEQIIARNYLVNEKPDVIVNVIDATNLERNFYLTIQLLELGIPVILALNIFDEAEKRGDKIDIKTIENLLGVKAIPTVSTKNIGLDILIKSVLDTANAKNSPLPRDLVHDEDIEEAVTEVEEKLNKQYTELTSNYPLRWLALKLLEEDTHVLSETNIDINDILSGAAVKHLRRAHGEDIESTTSDARYGKAAGLVLEVLDKPKRSTTNITYAIDNIVLNRALGLPVFLFAMWLMFKFTFDLSSPFVDWIDSVTSGPINRWAAAIVSGFGASNLLISLVTEGIIGGAGFVLIFVPVLSTMMFFITLLEGSGYMARVAFVMDRSMHSMGLHGNSFIPMLLGFGCNVPAVYATRTLEEPKERILTSLLVPMMSCSARLPVYVLFTSVFFTENAGTVMWSIYLLGVGLALLTGIVFRRILFKGETPMFILELPPYRIPTIKSLLIHTWEKVKHFIVKAGTFILAASIVVWFLLNLPLDVENRKDSFLGKAGQAISPIFTPLGFGTWQASSSLITGVISKEIVVGTMSEIYAAQAHKQKKGVPSFTEEIREIGLSFLQATGEAFKNVVSIFGIASLSADENRQSEGIKPFIRDTFTPLSAYAFMVFVLLYMPCIVTGIAFKHEFGSWKWFGMATAYGLTLAWVTAFVIYQGGRFLGIGV